ncbi:MAG: hypothetical protein LIO43_00225 [Clostridiales bacterium]|nr:hypothetical protein [Clostridiales bacterium]
MKKAAIILAAAIILSAFAACSKSAGDNSAKGNGSETFSSQQASSANTSNAQTATAITEDEAVKIESAELQKTDFSKFGINASVNDFEFQNCALGNGDWRETENGYKNQVWTVEYKYTDSLCDYVYFDIDSQSGAVLYTGYMGD